MKKRPVAPSLVSDSTVQPNTKPLNSVSLHGGRSDRERWNLQSYYSYDISRSED